MAELVAERVPAPLAPERSKSAANLDRRRWLATFLLLVSGWCLVSVVRGAERVFDFTQTPVNEVPEGFRSYLTGSGAPGDWRVIMDDAPSAMRTVTPAATPGNQRAVLAQLSRDPTDERFPILVYEDESYADFTFTTQFKTASGRVEQMAGIVFRFADERNYYVLRASSLGKTLRFYKFVNGVRSAPIGPDIEIPSGEWHELSVDCKGNTIRCLLNGKEAMPALSDNSFTQGKVGFWTKSDSVSYFVDARIVFTPTEMLATTLVKAALQKYPRALEVTLFAPTSKRPELHAVASNKPEILGHAGGTIEDQVIAKNSFAFGRNAKRKTVTVTLPLHDRNGEAVAAVRVELESFPGQTEQNAISRALPIVRHMEVRVRSAQDLTQ